MVDVCGPGRWRRSSRCADATCVEVDSSGAGVVSVRNSADPDVTLSLTAEQWQSFVDALKAGVLAPPKLTE